jgi:hypothetical protein
MRLPPASPAWQARIGDGIFLRRDARLDRRGRTVYIAL